MSQHCHRPVRTATRKANEDVLLELGGGQGLLAKSPRQWRPGLPGPAPSPEFLENVFPDLFQRQRTDGWAAAYHSQMAQRSLARKL